MSYRVIFSPLAEDDLFAIYGFIAKDSPDRAIAFTRRLRIQVRTLKTMPERGARRENLGPGICIMVLERRVTIAYRLENERIDILRLFYAGQNIPSTLVDDD